VKALKCISLSALAVVGVFCALLVVGGTGPSNVATAAASDGSPQIQWGANPITAFGSVELQDSKSSYAQFKGLATLKGKVEVMAENRFHHVAQPNTRGHWALVAWMGFRCSGGQLCAQGRVQWAFICPDHSSWANWRVCGGGHPPGHPEITVPNCGNPAVPVHSPPPPPQVVRITKIVLVTHFTFNVTTKATAVLRVSISTTATANCGASASGGTVWATDYASASAVGYAKGSSLVKVKGQAARQAKVSQVANLKQSASAKAWADIRAKVFAWCTAPPPTTTTTTTTTPSTTTTVTTTTTTTTNTTTTNTTTTPQCQPQIVNMTQLNDVPAGFASDNFKVTVHTCSNGTVKLAPDFGTIGPCGAGSGSDWVSFSVPAGDSTVCVKYFAPSEPPPGDSSNGIPAGDDAILVTLSDSSGSIQKWSVPFIIDPPPTFPG
jgi:hypothetical protein